MANQDAAFGFRPTRSLVGGQIRTEEYAIAANYNTAIYTGQVVEAVTAGGIEAAAAGIPSMVSNICGLSDTVVKNKTGLLHNVRDIDEISKLLKLTSKNKKLVKELGRAAMIRAVEEFNSDLIVNHWVKFYENVL